MANSKDIDERWVEERLGVLEAADLDPDLVSAWARLQDRQRASAPRARRVWFVTAAVAGLILLVLPWPRVTAQRLWDRLMLGRVEVVRTERSDVPEAVMRFFEMGGREAMVGDTVADIGEAERVAGFRPSLPPTEVLGGSPVLSVVRTVTLATAPINVAELRRALQDLGASDLQVPQEWEGATLTVEGGPIVVADYPDVQTEVMQTGPLRMTMPPGFRFEQFIEMAFRIFGRDATSARTLARNVAANPPLLMVLRPGDHAYVRELFLRSGTAAIVGDPGGQGGICLYVSTPNRLYFISAPEMDQDRALALARSLQ